MAKLIEHAFHLWVLFTMGSFLGFFILLIIAGIIQHVRKRELWNLPPFMVGLLTFLNAAWALPIAIPLCAVEWVWHRNWRLRLAAWTTRQGGRSQSRLPRRNPGMTPGCPPAAAALQTASKPEIAVYEAAAGISEGVTSLPAAVP